MQCLTLVCVLVFVCECTNVWLTILCSARLQNNNVCDDQIIGRFYSCFSCFSLLLLLAMHNASVCFPIGCEWLSDCMQFCSFFRVLGFLSAKNQPSVARFVARIVEHIICNHKDIWMQIETVTHIVLA